MSDITDDKAYIEEQRQHIAELKQQLAQARAEIVEINEQYDQARIHAGNLSVLHARALEERDQAREENERLKEHIKEQAIDNQNMAHNLKHATEAYNKLQPLKAENAAMRALLERTVVALHGGYGAPEDELDVREAIEDYLQKLSG